MNNRIELFKRTVSVLPSNEAKQLRQTYINRFVNVQSEYYKKKINTKQHFTDGECYVGYLWDTLLSWKKIQYKDILEYLSEHDLKLLVFWDIHSKEHIVIENYWVFEKEDMIEIKAMDLLNFLDLLPEDIYIFDRSIEWSFILTHESEGQEDWPESRIVLKI